MKRIDHAPCQWIVRTDNGEIDRVLSRECREAGDVVRCDGNVFPDKFGPGIPGRAEDSLNAWGLSQLPDQRVFPAATADDKNLHENCSDILAARLWEPARKRKLSIALSIVLPATKKDLQERDSPRPRPLLREPLPAPSDAAIRRD